MSKKLLLGVLALLMGWCVSVNAQVAILTENFEQGLPTTWTQDPATGVTAWTVSNSGLTGVTAHGGSNYVSLFTTNQQADTKLILPMEDISSLSTPELSFFLVQKARGVNTGYARDTLRIYARTSSTAAWTLVQTLSDEITVWARQSVDLSAIANANVQLALEFVYGSGLGIGIDDLRLGDASVCFTPTDLRAYRITSNSAELMWTAYEAAFEYGLKVSTTAMADPSAATADVLDQSVYFKPYAISGLTPSTTYYFYVSANCGNGDESAWSAAGTFTTACAPETLPYSDAMESTSSFATCWTKNWEANGDWSTTTPSASTYAPTTNTTHHGGSQSVRLYGYYSNSTSYATPRTIKSYIASHEINTTDIRNQQITFWGYGSTTSAKVHVGLLSDATDFSTFEELVVIPVSAASTWKEYTVPFASATNAAAKHVCFMVDGADGTQLFYYYIDDVLIEDIPACPKPTLVQARVVTSDHATIQWMGSSSAYNVKVSTTPLTNPDTDVADVLTTTVNTTSVNLSNLSSRTTYYLYVQSNCTAESNGTSVWADAFSFTTTSVAAVPPYSCGFEDPTENAQWDLYNSTLTNRWTIGSAINHGGSNALYISNDNGATAQYDIASVANVMAVRTILLPPGSSNISFDWQAGGESTIDYLRVELAPVTATFNPGTTAFGTATTAGFGGELLSQAKMNLTGGAWQHTSYNITVTDSTTYNLVFYWRDDTSIGTQPGACIDNVTIDHFTCSTPTNFTAGTPTVNGATFSWVSSGETQWQLQVMKGTNVVVDTLLTTATFTVNTLDANTAYSARIRGVCSATEFGYWQDLDFRTACDDIRTLPFMEDFQGQGTGTSAKPACWNITQQYSNYPYISSSAYNHTPNTGTTGAFYFYATASANNCVTLPRLSVPGKTIQDVQLSFYMLVTTLTYNITVGVMTDPTDFTTFTPVQTFNCDATSSTSSQNWKLIEVDFTSYTGNGQYIAFYDGTRGATNGVYIDDVVVELIPTCIRPKDLFVFGATENRAMVTFDGGTATNFEAVLVAHGNDITAANILKSVIAANDTITLNNLAAATSYDCYVRSICGAGDTSAWSLPYSFSTSDMPEQLPLITDFSNAADNAMWQFANGTQTNKWVIGNATGNGDSSALYISDDNGTSANYSITSTSNNYAYRLVKFTPGIYEVSFDWKAGGETTIDYLRAFLAPGSETFTAGSAGKLSANTTVPAGWISLNGTKGYLNDPSATSVIWKNVQQTITITDTVNMYILFYWRDDTSLGTEPGGCVDNLVISQLSCATTVHHDVYDTYNVMTFEAAQGTPLSYEVVVDTLPINFSNLSGVLHHVTTTAAVDSIGGLTPNTQYYAYVRTICSGNDTSRWFPANFKTECTIVNRFPYFVDFEDNTETGTGTTPNCWTHISGGNYPYIYNNRSVAGGTKCLYFYQSTTSDPNMVAMPKLNIALLQDYRVEFSIMYSSTTSYGLIVGAMSDLSDPTTFVPVDTVWTTQSNVWEPQVVRFRNYTGNGKYIVFYTDGGLRNAYNYINLDDITVAEDRLCETPTALSVTNLTGNGAQLNWGAGNGLTFDLLVTTSEVDPDTVTENSSCAFMYETALTENYVDLSGMLTTNTTYWFYVKADCNAADGRPSLWSEGYQFTTVCPAYTLPYSQNFVSPRPNEGVMPACWQTILVVTGTPSGSPAQIVEPAIYGGANSYQKSETDSCALRMACYNSTTANSKTYAILPEFSGSYAGYRLSFYNACTANLNGEIGGRLLIGTMTDVADASTFTPVDTLFNTNYWNFYALALDGITNTPGTHLALLWDGELNQKSGYFYIDQLAIEPYAACEAPTNVRIEVDGGNADVYLNTMSAADSIVEIVLTQGTDILKDTVMNVANLPWSISHLAGLTTYGVRARVVCNAADSTYSAWNYRKIEFTTGCVAMTLPYSYNFDEETQSGSGKRPTHCWTAFQTNGSTTYPYISTSTPSSAPYSLYFYGTTTYASVAVTPELDVTSMQNVVLTFKAKKSSAAYDVIVGVMTDPEDLTTFDTIATVTPTTTSTWQEMNVRFNNYTGNGRYIAFMVGGSKSSYMYIDDVYVEYEPTCHRPSAPVFVGNTTSSITASWTAGQDGETTWEITALPAGQEPDANTVITTVTTNQGTVTGLQPNTAYTFYVRAVCSATDHSNWVGTTMRTACTAVNVTDSTFFTEDFDSYGTGTSAHPSCWTTVTNYTTTAYPYISTTHHSGVGSLYFYGTASYYSYAATPQLTGTPTNELRVNFWGYKTSANYQMEVGVMTDPNDYSTFVTLATVSPDATSTWQEFNVDLTSYTGTGEYVAFRMPSAVSYMYLDDVTISPIPSCAEPTPSADPVLGTDSIRVTITPAHAEDTQWQVVVTPAATTAAPDMTAAVVDTIVNATEFYITGLTAATNYTVYARTVCSATENSAWRRSNFKTLCDAITILESVPFTENFDSYANLAQVDCWTGGQISTTYAFPNVVNAYSVSPSNSLRFNGGHAYITTPVFTNAINTLKVDFKLRQENATNSGVINVGVMSNPNDFSTFELVQTVSCNAISTFENFSINIADGGVVGNNKVIAFEQVTPSDNNYWYWMDDVVVSLVPACSAPGVSVDLVSSTSVDVTIAPGNVADTVFEYVLCPGTTAAVPPFATAIARDTVDLSGLEFSLNALTSNTAYSLYARALCGTEWTRNDFTTPASCAAPDVNVVFGNGNLYITLNPANPTDSAWEVVVNGNANDTTGSIFRQVVTSNSVTVPASYASTFHIHARTSCGDDWSAWAATSITTPCGVVTLPFTETFNTMPPSCWSRYSGLINDVMAGTATLTTTTSGWLANSTYCWQDPHAKINIYGTTYKYWLVTPEIYIDTTAVLSFDLGLTKYATSDPILDPTSQQDDRFVVAVSRDGGNTWTTSGIVAEWNNTGSSHVYNQIATTGERVELSLGNFVGDTIKIAFYGESTVSGGDNDLHLDNVNITAIHNIVDLTDNICDGYNYVGQGFNISSNEISLGGSNVFTRLVADTMYRLTLNVMPSAEIEINDSVCSGNLPYTLYGFNVSASGTYHRYLNTAAGCDSIVTLNLVVKNGYTDSETVTVCASALPYLWNGQSLNAAGTYTHTVAGPGGCDSIYTLTLVVNQDKQTTENVAVCDNELPYTWNGQSLTAAGTYTFNGTTSTGCDSVATLNLTVNATYSNNEYLTLHDYELPYTWNGQEITAAGSYTFNGTTAAGCDSVITLTLTVTVGLDYAEDGMFNITPNPVEKGGVVRIDATVKESAVVELFTANGKLVARSEHNTEAIYVTMPQVAGLYMVRLTTETGKVMYGKVIVR